MGRRSTPLYDSATFWALLGGGTAVVSGAPTAVGVAQANAVPSPDYWLNALFDAGIGLLLAALLMLFWALILYVAHGHLARHQSSVTVKLQPAVRRPTAPSERRQAQQQTVDKMLGHTALMMDAASRSDTMITAPLIASGITVMDLGRLKESVEGRTVVNAHDRCVQLYRETDGMGVWTVNSEALGQAVTRLEEAADRWRALPPEP